MKRLVIILAVFLLVCSTVSVVSATSVDFKIGSDNSIDYSSTGLDITSQFSPSLEGTTFSLIEGDYYEFDYLDISKIVVDSSETSFDITANLSFVLPKNYVVGNEGTGNIVKIKSNCSGNCGGNSNEFNIYFELETVLFGNGGAFTVQLSPFTADKSNNSNKKCSVTSPCYYYPQDETITATVTLLKAPISVPEPTTFMMFGTVLIGAIGIRRFK